MDDVKETAASAVDAVKGVAQATVEAVAGAVTGTADVVTGAAETVAGVADTASSTAANAVRPHALRTPLPDTRPELLALHRDLRRRRDASPLMSEERAHLAAEIGRVEVEVARVERAMDPPRV